MVDKKSTDPSQKRSSVTRPLPGLRLGKYKLEARIASGGMGEVFRATHVSLGGELAIKVLKRSFPGKEMIFSRFKQEAQVLARLNHPNIVHVIDVGEEKGFQFIAMDYAVGMDLRRWFTRDGKLSPRNLLFVARQLSEAIAAAHKLDIVHRDIKPDNVIVDSKGTVRVTDFGLASDVMRSGVEMEQQDFASVPYAAPEVLRGEQSDRRSDVFSLAATLYHAATGILPFGKESTASILANQLRGAGDLQLAVPALPSNFCQTIMKSLSADPEMRPASAAQFLEEAFSRKRAQLFAYKQLMSVRALVGMALTVSASVALYFLWSNTSEERLPRESIAKTPERSEPEVRESDEESSPGATGSAESAGEKVSISSVRETRARLALDSLRARLDQFQGDEFLALRINALANFTTRFPSTPSTLKAQSEIQDLKQRLREKLQSLSPEEYATLKNMQESSSLLADMVGKEFVDEISTPDLDDIRPDSLLSRVRGLMAQARPFEAEAALEEAMVPGHRYREFAAREIVEVRAEIERRSLLIKEASFAQLKPHLQSRADRIKHHETGTGIMASLDRVEQLLSEADTAAAKLELNSWVLEPKDELKPYLEDYANEARLCIEAYEWLRTQLKANEKRDIRIGRRGQSSDTLQRVYLLEVSKTGILIDPGDQREHKTLLLQDILPATWMYFAERAKDDGAKSKAARCALRVALLQRDPDSMKSLQVHIPESDQRLISWTRFGQATHEVFEDVLVLGDLRSAELALLDKESALSTELWKKRGSGSKYLISAFDALFSARQDVKGYSSSMKEVPLPYLDPYFLALDIMEHGASLEAAKTLNYFSPDSALSAHALAIAHWPDDMEKVEGRSRVEWARLAIKLNPWDRDCWRIANATN